MRKGVVYRYQVNRRNAPWQVDLVAIQEKLVALMLAIHFRERGHPYRQRPLRKWNSAFQRRKTKFQQLFFSGNRFILYGKNGTILG